MAQADHYTVWFQIDPGEKDSTNKPYVVLRHLFKEMDQFYFP